MSKRELIDAIMQHNRTAAPEFLAQFAESDLKAYLDRMCLITSGQPPKRIQTCVDSRKRLQVA